MTNIDQQGWNKKHLHSRQRIRPPAAAAHCCAFSILLSFQYCHDNTYALSFSSSSLPNLVKSHPCLGHTIKCNGSTRTHFYVIGTSHLRCKSASEVKSLIREIKPDGVVVELDPERVIRLTKEGSKHPDEEQLFGADFLATIDTAKEMDVPLFIGDEYQKETRERLIQTAIEPQSYGPGRLMSAFFSFFVPKRAIDGSNGGDMMVSSSYINVQSAFAADPMKFAPLLATASPALVAFLATIQNYQIEDVGNDAATALSLLFSFFATCKIFNNFIADRDDILAYNSIRAANVVSSLKRKETIRARWTFTVNGNDAKSINGKSEDEKASSTISGKNPTPLFTLKTPLETGKVRNLNLFEPRWLKMVDDVCARQPDVVLQSFGCVTCTNKFYSAIQLDGAEGRYADVVFERRGTMAELTNLVEGKRPVSGDRKVSARIKGRDSFVVDEDQLAISKEGYLVASGLICDDGEYCEDIESNGDIKDGDDIRIVTVVGLLHANGVIDRLGMG